MGKFWNDSLIHRLQRPHFIKRILRWLLFRISWLDVPARLLWRGRFSWALHHDDIPADLEKYLAYPLISWVNYHQHSILGKQCFWMGHRAMKNPMDAWIYQEIVYEVRPDYIIEIGNANGGTTLFLANICDLLNHGQVIGLDIDHGKFGVSHPRIELLTGECSSSQIVEAVQCKVAGKKALVIHDAEHTRDAVSRDLRLYSPLVSVGSYFIVEDSFEGIRGFNSRCGERPGVFSIRNPDSPLQAIECFIRENKNFIIDRSRERYILTSNYKGYLKRIR